VRGRQAGKVGAMKLRTLLLVLAMLPWTGLHAEKTANMRVSATVPDSCDVAVPDVALDAPRGGVTYRPVLRATCSPAATYFVGQNEGRFPSAPSIERRVESALVRPALTGVGKGKPADHTLFGETPIFQLVPTDDGPEPMSVRVYY
jgi:hypothetical protein